MGGHAGRSVAVVAFAAAWLGGAAMQMQQAALWPARVYVAGVAVALVCLIAVGLLRRRLHWALAVPALLMLSFSLTGLRAGWRMAETLPAALQGQEVAVTGVIAAMPRIDATGARFVFDVESASLHGGTAVIPSRLSVGWYRGWGDESLGPAEFQTLRAGQRWRFTLRLKAPHGLMNPDGFDFELWLFEQGIRATGSVRDAPPPLLLAADVAAPVERWRQTLRDRLVQAVPDARIAGVLAALAVGDQAAIERADWDLFRITGVAHLMSISGLHVTMFAWGAGLLVGGLWRRSERAMLALPAPLASRWGGVLAAAAYALLAGWGVPAQRTVWMLVTLALLRMLGLRWPGLAMLSVAGAVVCAIDPWALMQPGFWLSFFAVALLMGAQPVSAQPKPEQLDVATSFARARRTLIEMTRTQAIATLGLAPLSILFFQQISIVGFVSNFVAVPLVTLVITPLALAALIVPPLAVLAGLALQPLIALLTGLAQWPAAVWTAAAPSPWAFAFGLVGAAVLVMPLPWRLRALGLLLLAPLLWPIVERPASGRFELIAADIGQGSAVLVRTSGHLLLVDTGPQYSPDSDAGSRVLLPLLRARGESAIDMLVLTHRDTDHVGGADTLLAGFPVRELRSSIEAGHPLLAQAQAAGVPQQRCESGQSWSWDDVQFRVLHPTTADYDIAQKTNAMSCVIQVTDATGHAALITGDIERAQEQALVRREGAALHSEVLLAPHHGSRTSSSQVFIDSVAPRTVVVQAGDMNRFGHPAGEVVARYAAFGAQVVRTDRCGAWGWGTGDSWCTRVVRRRYWHATPPAIEGPLTAERPDTRAAP